MRSVEEDEAQSPDILGYRARVVRYIRPTGQIAECSGGALGQGTSCVGPSLYVARNTLYARAIYVVMTNASESLIGSDPHLQDKFINVSRTCI